MSETQVTVEEAKRVYVSQVDAWIEALQAHGLIGGTFTVKSAGSPLEISVAADVGVFWSLFEQRGCKIESHSAQLIGLPQTIAGGPPKNFTLTSLLVRLPVPAN